MHNPRLPGRASAGASPNNYTSNQQATNAQTATAASPATTTATTASPHFAHEISPTNNFRTVNSGSILTAFASSDSLKPGHDDDSVLSVEPHLMRPPTSLSVHNHPQQLPTTTSNHQQQHHTTTTTSTHHPLHHGSGSGGDHHHATNSSSTGATPVDGAAATTFPELSTQDDIEETQSEFSSSTHSTQEEGDPLHACVMEILQQAKLLGAGSPKTSNPPMMAGSLNNPTEQQHPHINASAPRSSTMTPLPAEDETASAEHHQTNSFMVRYQLAMLFQNLATCESMGLMLVDIYKQKILHVNEAGQRILGRLDLVGQSIDLLLPHAMRQEHPGRVVAYLERYRAEYKRSSTVTESRFVDDPQTRHVRVVRTEQGHEVEFDASIHLHSVRLPCESISQPARIMALEFQDIGRQKSDSLDAKMLRNVLAHVSEGVVIADLEGKIEWMNTAAEVLSGYSLKALVDRQASVSIFVQPEFFDRHESYLHHYHQKRLASLADAQSCTDSHEVVLQRRDKMRTAHGFENVQLRVEVTFNKLIAYIKSTQEFIPREDFETERLKLLLPSPIVRKIKAEPGRDITSFHWEFPQSSILFTDVKGFSTWARNQSVKNVHDRMQPMFKGFEELVQAFGGELIHRIGDAVMVVFGFNGNPRHHARLAVACATELQLWACENGFRVRVGVNSGPIGAGIYGAANGRPGFDLWGPNVNLAKRLEEHGVAGAVHVSQSVIDAVGTHFRHVADKVLKRRHLKGVKGADGGQIDTYLLPVSRFQHHDDDHTGMNQTSTDAARKSSSPTPQDNTESITALPEDFLQLVNFQRAEYGKWLRKQEETTQRLAELAKGQRR